MPPDGRDAAQSAKRKWSQTKRRRADGAFHINVAVVIHQTGLSDVLLLQVFILEPSMAKLNLSFGATANKALLYFVISNGPWRRFTSHVDNTGPQTGFEMRSRAFRELLKHPVHVVRLKCHYVVEIGAHFRDVQRNKSRKEIQRWQPRWTGDGRHVWGRGIDING
ncbi:hypothetical protein B0H16DRAFT_1456629 [Mycena metata]|uniref:Uncharacterized protein n=1 Tax=Mycena metata TaxID=1033252 RepID=A0AAD7JBU0_9AGAR|nr:hypothetical protein B0H16DRAFT_1456629 [Mycena metata]